MQRSAMQKYFVCTITFVLITTLLVNKVGLSLSFETEFFAHELDHMHQNLSSEPTAHLEVHQNSFFNNDSELDAATHLCLHATGQYQPFYFIRLSITPPQLESNATLAAYMPLIAPDSILESPYHPPRII